MRFRYRVYHSEEAKSAIDRFFHSFDRDRVQHEYDHFDTALHLHFDGTTIRASSQVMPDGRGVVVILEADLEERRADESLSSFLAEHNKTIQGLCMLIEKESS